MRFGALCVMMVGPVLMPMWPAEILDTHDLVRLRFYYAKIGVLHCN